MAVLSLEARRIAWRLREPFVIARGPMTEAEGVLVTLTDAAGRRGRGEAYGIIYEGETPATMLAQLAGAREFIERGARRNDLAALLPAGGARCAVDCALWDLEAKTSGVTAFAAAGIAVPQPLVTAFTIGMRPPADVTATAARFADFPLLKLKVDARDPLATIAAARAGAPHAQFIVDPNQSWDIDLLRSLAPRLIELGVVLLEQPLPVDGDDGQRDFASPIPICADELIHDRGDLAKASGKYSHVNIKLDKTGGLTEALALVHAARAAGFGLMVGCMAGSSLAMAPAHVVGQLCDFVDLDGPLLQNDDWPSPLGYAAGRVGVPGPALWG